jgi:shikimate kinase
MMGVGKSTVGRLLAERLGWRYIDNDEALLAATGRTARELLETGGTAALRDGEARALEASVGGEGPAVVGVAAGMVLSAHVRRRLPGFGTVVWLRANSATLIRRVAGETGEHRPQFAGAAGTPEWFATETPARAPLYAEVAHVIVDVDRTDGSERSPAEIVDEVMRAVPLETKERHP